MRVIAAIAAAAMLAGCGGEPPDGKAAAPQGQPAAKPEQAGGWKVQSANDATTLVLNDSGGAAVIRLICPARQNLMLVNVPAFKPIGSEERLSAGSGASVVAFVADVRGDAQRGGVTGTSSIPDELKELVHGPISASYGAQSSGPHQAPPFELGRSFVLACAESANAARQAASRPTASTSPCHVQDGELLRLPRQKALGTEPFWAATIDGRCITYSTPDDQKGTRIWTKVGTGPMGPIWVGAFQGKPFVLRTQPAVRCSDGMSDKVYDIEARLTVTGEERRGCAERL